MKQRTLTLTLLLLAAAAAAFSVQGPGSGAAGAGREPQSRRGRTQRRPPAAPRRPRVDYTKFSHTTPAHRRDSCASCHKTPSDNWTRVRARDAAFPDITDYPEHASCLNCHRQQFFSGARPAICSVCHTAVSPRADERHPFANPAEEFARTKKGRASPREFAPIFPHDLHQDVMARHRPFTPDVRGVGFVRASFVQGPAKQERPNSCSVCHQTYRPQPAPTAVTPGAAEAGAATATLPEGFLKTTPTGHASCFNCHWQEGGERPFSSDCAGCHRLLPQALEPTQPPVRDTDAKLGAQSGFTDLFAVRKLLRRDSVNFAHDEENHRGIDCASCHTRIPALSTLDETTLKVPILSCGGGSGCHISVRPKKILNEEVDKKLADASFRCVKCHVNFAGEKTPKSHLDAVGK